MKALMNRIGFVTVLATLQLSMASCQKAAPISQKSADTESPEEAIVEVAAEAGDVKRTIELADSFVNLNLLSSIRADFYKAMACNRQEELRWLSISKRSSRPTRRVPTKTCCSIAGQP